MGKKKDKGANGQIQTLLQERKQIEQWLVRLDKAADRTPEAVRVRVRGDYETRLQAVVTELQGYEEDLRGSLEEVQARQAEARTEEKAATEELAEAELRYAVGEFDDGAWSEKKAGILDRLISIRETLGQTEEEIAELEDVLANIAAPPATEADEDETEPAAEPTDDEDSEPEIAELDDVDESEAEEPAPKAKPKGPPGRITLGSELGLRNLQPKGAAKKEPKPQTEAFGDELAFLKALSDDGTSGTPAARPAEPKPPPPPAVPDRVDRLSEQQAVSRSRPSVINQRTLKCGECGAMNLPTEWYCDRCGAELASL